MNTSHCERHLEDNLEMERKVKGTLFLTYVIAIKGAKGVDLEKYLSPEELEIISQPILSSNWYSFDTYERMGMVVLKEIVNGDMEQVRQMGRMAIEYLLQTYKNVVVEDNPLESVKKFEILRNRFFNFSAINVVPEGEAKIHMKMDFGLEALPEEAAAYQASGSIERLVELAGAKNTRGAFIQKKWMSDPETIFELEWD